MNQRMVCMRLAIVIGLLVVSVLVEGCVEPDRYMPDAEQSGQANGRDQSHDVQKDRSQSPSRTTSPPGSTGSY